MPKYSALRLRNERIAVCTSYFGRIAFVCAYADFVKGTVIFRLTVVCTADDRTFNAFVFTTCVHFIYPPCSGTLLLYADSRKIKRGKICKKTACFFKRAVNCFIIRGREVQNVLSYTFRIFQHKCLRTCLRDIRFRRIQRTWKPLLQGLYTYQG